MGYDSKQIDDAYPAPREDEEALNLTKDWTAEEEKAAKRK
jgi:hypothetical protein